MNKFILFALLTIATQALFENSYIIKSANKMQDFRAILESDFVSMIYFYTEDCENCLRASTLVEKIAEDQEGIINVFGANCDQINKDPNSANQLPYCSEDMLDQLPQISFFEPPQYKINPYTKEPMIATEHRFQGEASPQSLGTFGHKFIPNNNYNILKQLIQNQIKLSYLQFIQ